MPWVELTDINGDLDEFEIDGLGNIQGLGRRRRNRAGRMAAREARRAARVARRAARRGGVGPGRNRTRVFATPGQDGMQFFCPAPGDLIVITDEPIYDTLYLTDLSTWPQRQTFFDTRIRDQNNQGPALTNLLTLGKHNYDMDIESFAVSFHPVDGNTRAINLAQQRLLEAIGRGVFEYKVQQQNNIVFPVADCPAGSGTFENHATTENNMRTLSIQNGSPAKGRRRLNKVVAARKDTAFNCFIHVSVADAAMIAALTDDPSIALGVRVGFYGPEGIPLVPSSAGQLSHPQGVLNAG